MLLLLLMLVLVVMPVQAAESTGYIFVGDSRTVGVSEAVDAPDNVYFVAEVGKGYSWFCDTALGQVDEIIGSHDYDDWVIVSSLGVNDLGNAEKYKQKYKDLCSGEWKDYEFYIVSVTCIDESKYQGTVTNEAIREFNSRMQYYRNYIDIYGLSEDTIISRDGLHYCAEVYEQLYDEVIRRIA